MLPLDVNEFQEKVSTHFRPWQRSFHFRPWQRSFQIWVRAVDIYTSYKVFQVRANFERNMEKREAMWEKQHEVAADKIYNMCSDLGGFFLKVYFGQNLICTDTLTREGQGQTIKVGDPVLVLKMASSADAAV